MGSKVAITSNTPQTTRHRFRAVKNLPGCQMVLVDTPGIHKPHDALGEELNRSASKALEDVDVIAYCLDAAAPFGSGDEYILDTIRFSPAKKLLVLTKVDLAVSEQCQQQQQAADSYLAFDGCIATSAMQHAAEYARLLCQRLSELLPEGPCWFPTDMTTDQPLEVLIAEFIREKILRSTFDEVPHAVGVQVDELQYDSAKRLHRLYAIIYVERESQKGIIIGKGGEHIKQIGTQARVDLEHLLGTRVFLDLRVKVRKDWRKDANQIRRFGYGEGA
jgi:GTP-binding protein Era